MGGVEGGKVKKAGKTAKGSAVYGKGSPLGIQGGTEGDGCVCTGAASSKDRAHSHTNHERTCRRLLEKPRTSLEKRRGRDHSPVLQH